MPTLVFNCQSCHNRLEAPPQYAGVEAPCPFCQRLTRAPNDRPEPSSESNLARREGHPAPNTACKPSPRTMGRPNRQWQRLAITSVLITTIAVGLVASLTTQSASNLEAASLQSEIQPFATKAPLPAEDAWLMGETVKRFLSAASIDEKLAYVLNPERIAPRMRRYYQEHEAAPTWADDNDLDAMIQHSQASGIPYGREQVYQLECFPLLSAPVVAFFARQEDGRFLLHWEAFVGLGDTTLSAFLKERPRTPERLLVSVAIAQPTADTPYLANHQLVRLTANGGGATTIAYIPLASARPDVPASIAAFDNLPMSGSALENPGDQLTVEARFVRIARQGDLEVVIVDKLLQQGWLEP